MANAGLELAVMERRLRPIYDALEASNSKKALHEAEKVLKKTPNLQCGRALKGYALFRLGRAEECSAIINQIMNEDPIDNSTMSVLSFVFKETDDYGKISKIYEKALAKDSTNEELQTQLFMSYGPLEDYAAQQRVAMQLYKTKQKKPYYCWAVVSCLLKSSHGPEKDDPVRRQLSLDLAQRMMERLIADKKLDAEQEAQLYLLVLNEQRKFTEQLEFLESDAGKAAYPNIPLEKRMWIMGECKKWTALNLMAKNLLIEPEYTDRWDLYVSYINSVLQLVLEETKVEVAEGEQKPDTSFEECNEFLSQVIAKNDKKYRAPYLARIHLFRIMHANSADAEKLLGGLMELFVDFFRLFGEKPCCSKDLVNFLDLFTPEKLPDLAAKLLQLCNISSTTLPQTKEQMQRHICALQISRICGSHLLNAEHLSALYTAFTLHYEHGLNALTPDSLPTDIPIADAYALLAVYVMYDLAVKLKSSNHMVEALCLLNYLITNSPGNFHAKLLCLQLYHRIGCSWGAQKVFEQINLKFVQLDSMGYLHNARLATSGLFVQARSNYEATLKFFTASVREGYEYRSNCYKYGSFGKIHEVTDFQNRIKYSAHYALISLDVLINDLVCICALNSTYEQQMNAFKMMAITCKIDYSKLKDNRDLTAIVSWDPRSIDEEHIIRRDSCLQDLAVVMLRNDLLQFIGICVQAITKETYTKTAPTEDSANQGIEDKCDALIVAIDNWMNIFAAIRQKNYTRLSNERLVKLLPSRLHGLLEMPYEQIFDALARLILSLEQRYDKPIDTVWKNFDKELMDLSQSMCDAIKTHNEETDLLWDRHSVQEKIVLAVEIYGLVCFVMSVAHERYMAVLTNRTNKRSKKKPAEGPTVDGVYVATDKERITAITSIITRLKTELNLMDAAVESLKKPVLAKGLTETLESLSLNPHVETIVDIMISKSHEIVVDEIRTVLKDKLRALNALTKYNL